MFEFVAVNEALGLRSLLFYPLLSLAIYLVARVSFHIWRLQDESYRRDWERFFRYHPELRYREPKP
jgi:3-deoxy-D-manno-octulosonic-acid transferase